MRRLSTLVYPTIVCLVLAAVLAFSTGSVQLDGAGHAAGTQSICRAPDHWIHSTLDSVPIVRDVPATLGRIGKSMEARMPDITESVHRLPVGKGSLIEGWILKSAPRYL